MLTNNSLLIVLFLPIAFLIFYKPEYLILVPIYGVMFSLPLNLWIGKLSFVTLILQLIGLLASLILFFRSSKSKLFRPILKSLFLLTFICTMGFIIGIPNVDFIVQLQAIKILILPVVLSIGSINKHFNWQKYLKTLIILLCFENIVAIIELRMGIFTLMTLGLEYGSELRQIKGQLRPPALFLNHFEYGLFSASVFVACLSLKRYSASQNYAWMNAGLIISSLGVFLSTARTAVIIVLVSYILKNQTNSNIFRIHSKRIVKIINSIGVLSVVALIFPSLVASESLYSRVINWQNILSRFNIVIGNGLGSAGGATSSNFYRQESKVIVDNYFLSLLSQIGVLGLCLFIFCLLGLTRLPLRHKYIVFALVSSFLTLESWEYFGAMTILLISMFSIGRFFNDGEFNDELS